MDDKQRQIEEMAKILCPEWATEFCADECNDNTCANTFIAESLYEAGYRKADDVIDEFVERVKERALHSCHKIINCYEVTRIETVIDDIADEMRQEVEK